MLIKVNKISSPKWFYLYCSLHFDRMSHHKHIQCVITPNEDFVGSSPQKSNIKQGILPIGYKEKQQYMCR